MGADFLHEGLHGFSPAGLGSLALHSCRHTSQHPITERQTTNHLWGIFGSFPCPSIWGLQQKCCVDLCDTPQSRRSCRRPGACVQIFQGTPLGQWGIGGE